MSYTDRQLAADAAYARDYRAWIASLPSADRARVTAQGLAAPDTSRRTSTRDGDPLTLALTESDDPTPLDAIQSAEPPEAVAAAAAIAAKATAKAARIAARAAVAPSASPAPVPAHPAAQDAILAPPPTHTAADVLASFCARIRAHPNPLLAFDAACFATGLMDIEGLSQSALAARHGVTRAAFSKLAVQWADTFGLPPSRGMRSARARHSARQARLTFLSKHHDHHTHAT